MSDDFKDRDDMNTEETNTENDANENTAEQNFIMKESDEVQEPGKAPTPENSRYAYSYRKSIDKERQEEKKEEASEAEEERRQYGQYHFTAPIPPQPQDRQRKSKKSKSIAKKAGIFLASAAAFGLVAGVVFQGVNYAADQILPNNDVKIENTPISNGTTNISTENEGLGSVSEVARNVMPSIVSITSLSVQEVPNYFGFGTQQYPSESSGSGIIVGQNDTELLIATNNHVVQDADSLTVCFTNQDGTAASSSNLENTSTQSQNSEGGNNSSIDTGSAVAGQVKGTDADNDLAVVAVKLSDIPEDVRSEIKVATIGDSDSLIIGEQVVAIGNALGYGQSVTSGYVSALNKQVSSENADSTFIQTDAAINPGNSGGALLNMKGELVGINSAKIASDEVEGMGFAIPISKAQPILDQLMSRETREKVEDEDKAAYLGVICSDVISESAERYHIPVGVFVEDIEENGPADEAGIKKGDIIVKIDGTSVKTATNLTEQLQYYEAGEEVEFVVSRADEGEYKEQTINVKLGAKKDSTTQNQMQQQGR